MGTELDVLAIGNLYLRKSEQDTALKLDYSGAFEFD
jgi:carbamoyltransferase